MDAPAINPQNLESIFSQNPSYWDQAQGLIDQSNQGVALTQQGQGLDNMYKQQSMPARLSALDLANQTSTAQLPGIQATSDLTVRKNSNQAATNDAELKDTLGKLSQADRERHIQDVNDAGDIFRQNAGQVLNNPIGAAQRVKAELVAAGHGDMWNPAWDSFPPEGLAAVLKNQGDNIGQSTQKMLELSAGITAKKDLAISTENVRQQGRMEVQNARDATATQIAAGVRSARLALDKPNMQQLAARMSQLAEAARADGDNAGYQKYSGLANDYMDQARSIPASAPGTSNQKSVDISTLTGGDVPTIAPQVAPRLGGAPVAPPAAVVPPQGPASSAPVNPYAVVSTGRDDPLTKAFGEPPNPDKYIYRQDPVTGKLQRKLKQ